MPSKPAFSICIRRSGYYCRRCRCNRVWDDDSPKAAMKPFIRTLFCIILSGLISTVVITAQSNEELSIRRFGLYVASNNGGDDRQRLKYADDDVISLSITMNNLGGIAIDDELRLFEPDAAAPAGLALVGSAASTIFSFRAVGSRVTAGRLLRMVLRFMNSSPVKNVEIRVFRRVLIQLQPDNFWAQSRVLEQLLSCFRAEQRNYSQHKLLLIVSYYFVIESLVKSCQLDQCLGFLLRQGDSWQHAN